MGHKAAVRLANLTHGSGKRSLGGAERHAKRDDEASQRRSISDPARNFAWSKAGFSMGGGGCDIIQAHELHKAETGAEERANAAPAMHLMAIVSPVWLLETGNPRDLGNSRVMDLIHEAQLWAEKLVRCGLRLSRPVRYRRAGCWRIGPSRCASKDAAAQERRGEAGHLRPESS
ncbi:hypothetical protein [Palleronia sp.]|uniref:hypothetical protein n=1 Tax=Palleronia sp. TaxID=1940284 RepID=UPI0035C796CA